MAALVCTHTRALRYIRTMNIQKFSKPFAVLSLIAIAGFTTVFAVACASTKGIVGGDSAHLTTYIPKGGYASTTGAEYVAPSISTSLTHNQKIGDLTSRNYAGETIVQRLTERTYWAQTGFYVSVFYVGDAGVLVIDPVYPGSEQILGGIRSVTDKPITAVVYSHHHSDHIGGIGTYYQEAANAGVALRVIATNATADYLLAIGSQIPQPTEQVDFLDGETTFEQLTIQVRGFSPAAHTNDAAVWLLKEERVAHAPDLINPDQLPFLNLAGSQTYQGYTDNIRALDAMDWEFLSGGHGNVGYHEDAAFTLKYAQDLEDAFRVAYTSSLEQNFYIAKYNNHAASGQATADFLINNSVQILRPTYNKYYGFEASAPHHVRMLYETL